MKKIVYFLIIILILIMIFLIFYKSKKIIFDDHTIFNMWDEYVINPEKDESIQIDIFKKVSNGNKVHGKIAPGSYGSFIIKLIRPENSKIDIQIKDMTSKPQNLMFILDNREFYSMEEMQEELKEKFLTEDSIKIDWKWQYETSQKGDIEDTKSGENPQSYIFEINAMIEE